MNEAEHANPHTARIAEFVSSVRYTDLPGEVLARIKLLMLDSLGCALYAPKLPWSQILIKQLTALDETRTTAVWGTEQRLSAPHAALANGTLVQGFELDDVHRKGVLHVGAVTLPALFGVIESGSGFSGRDFLTAAVAGYEVGPRVGLCMGPEHIGQGWHSGATLGVYSAAAGAARALGLDQERTVHALGIAGTQSAGLMAAQYGSMVKRMHAGRASQSGLYGALLASGGFTGIVNVFESEYGGFCSTFSRSTDRYDLNRLSADIGESYETMNIALKFYSCVGSNHTTLDAIRMMQDRHPFTADDVEHITVHGSQVTVDHVGWPYTPQGLTSAQLNLPYCVATLLLEGDVFVAQFSEEMVADPARMALSTRVTCEEDPAITALGAPMRHKVRVEVLLRDGTHMEETVESARGSEHRFASEQDVVDKFHKLAAESLSAARAEQLCERMLNLEKETDARQLAALLVAG